jgi:hypothetical protein
VLVANFVTPELISDFWTVKKESEIEIYNALNISASMIKGIVLYLKEKKSEAKHCSSKNRHFISAGGMLGFHSSV